MTNTDLAMRLELFDRFVVALCANVRPVAVREGFMPGDGSPTRPATAAETLLENGKRADAVAELAGLLVERHVRYLGSLRDASLMNRAIDIDRIEDHLNKARMVLDYETDDEDAASCSTPTLGYLMDEELPALIAEYRRLVGRTEVP